MRNAFFGEKGGERWPRTVKPENHILTLRIPDPECLRPASHGHALGLEAFLVGVRWVGKLDSWYEGSVRNLVVLFFSICPPHKLWSVEIINSKGKKKKKDPYWN